MHKLFLIVPVFLVLPYGHRKIVPIPSMDMSYSKTLLYDIYLLPKNQRSPFLLNLLIYIHLHAIWHYNLYGSRQKFLDIPHLLYELSLYVPILSPNHILYNVFHHQLHSHHIFLLLLPDQRCIEINLLLNFPKHFSIFFLLCLLRCFLHMQPLRQEVLHEQQR